MLCPKCVEEVVRVPYLKEYPSGVGGLKITRNGILLMKWYCPECGYVRYRHKPNKKYRAFFNGLGNDDLFKDAMIMTGRWLDFK